MNPKPGVGMSDDLQPLIERIQKQGVDKAKAEADQIVAKAKEQAAGIVRDAEDKKKRLVEQGRQEAETYEERSRKTLEQAARDVLITVSRGIENIMSDLVAESVDQAMDEQLLKDMLVKIVEHCASRSGDVGWDVMVSPEDKERLIHFFANLYKQKMASGIQLKADNDILKGFKVSFQEGYVYLDFTSEALADSLSGLLRPHLADIVKRVAHDGLGFDRIKKCLQQSRDQEQNETVES